MGNAIQIEQAAPLFKLLGDKTRLTMLRILLEQDLCVCEFVEIFQASQPAISQHLRKLRDAGLVKETRRGQWMFYSLNRQFEHIHYVELLLASLPSQKVKIEELETKGKRISCD